MNTPIARISQTHILVLLLAVPSVFAQDRAVTIEADCQVTFQVHDDVTGEPISDARVSFWRPGTSEPNHIRSATEKMTSIDLAPGRWIAIASAESHVSGTGSSISGSGHSRGSSINLEQPEFEYVVIDCEPGGELEIDFALHRISQGQVTFSVSADSQLLSPHIVIWKESDRKPAAILDASEGPLTLTLSGGDWCATAASVWDGMSRQAGVNATPRSTRGPSKHGSLTQFSVSDAKDNQIDFATSEPMHVTTQGGEIEIGCWANHARQEIRDDAIVVLWQDYEPDTLVAIAAGDSGSIKKTIAPGIWNILGIVPKEDGNVTISMAGSGHDTEFSRIEDHQGLAATITTSIRTGGSYTFDLVFGNEDELTPPTTPVGPTLNAATIFGTVFSEFSDGRPVELVSDAQVELADRAGIIVGKQVTNENGQYMHQDVLAGDYKATISGRDIPTTTRDVRIEANVGMHVLDFLVMNHHSAPVTGLGKAEISVFEKNETGKHRRTDARVILTRGDEIVAVDKPDLLSGEYQLRLQPGLWKLTVSAPAASTVIDDELEIAAGTPTPHEVILNSGVPPHDVSALVAVLRETGQNSELPAIQFVGPGTVAADLEQIPEDQLPTQEVLGGNSGADQWDWYWARPVKSLTAGEYLVDGRVADYPAAQSTKQFIGNTSIDFLLTLRPSRELGTVEGLVSVQDGQGVTSPLVNATVVFQSPESKETRTVQTDQSGRYSTQLPPGHWWGSAKSKDRTSPKAQTVKITSQETQRLNFQFAIAPTTPPTTESANVLALVGIVTPQTVPVSPVVKFHGGGRVVELQSRAVSDEEREEWELSELSELEIQWFFAQPDEELPEGEYSASATLDELATSSERLWVRHGEMTQYLLFLRPSKQSDLQILVTDDMNRPIEGATIQLNQPFGDATDLSLKTDSQGESKKSTSTGMWTGMVTAEGFEPRRISATVQPGETKQVAVTLTSTRDSNAPTAIVMVKRSWPGVVSPAPTVLFGETPVVAQSAESLLVTDGEQSDLELRNWDYFEALAPTSIRNGTTAVTARLEGFTDSQQTMVWEEGKSPVVFLKLLPTPSPGGGNKTREVELYGKIQSQSGDQPIVPFADASLRLTSFSDAKLIPIDVTPNNGSYSTPIPVGVWKVEVIDSDNQIRAQEVVELGNWDRQQQDFLISQGGNEQPNRPVLPGQVNSQTSIAVLVEVFDRNNEKAPAVKVSYSAMRDRSELSDEPNVDPIPYELKEIQLNTQRHPIRSAGSVWYVATLEIQDIMQGSLVTATADLGQEWIQVPRQASTQVNANGLTILKLALRSQEQTTLPGTLLGCISFGESEGWEGNIENGGEIEPIARRSEGTPDESSSYQAIFNSLSHGEPASVVARSLDTGRTRNYFVDQDGCFEISLSPGKWAFSVLIPGLEPWPIDHGEPIFIEEGVEVQRDVMIPYSRQLPHQQTDVKVYVAVRRSSLRQSSVIPEVKLEMPITEKVEQVEPAVDAQGQKFLKARVVDVTKTVSIPCEVTELSFTQTTELNLIPPVVNVPELNTDWAWYWYEAIPAQDVPSGVWTAVANAEGYDQIFANGNSPPKRIVSPGTSVVFDVAMIAYQTKIRFAVTDSDNKPRSNVDIHIVNLDIKQSILNAPKVTTNAAGTAETTLAMGTGRYNFLLSGTGLTTEGREEEVREREVSFSYRVFAEGERKSYPLPILVLQEELERPQGYRDSIGPDPPQETPRTGQPVPHAQVQILPADDQTIPSSLTQPAFADPLGRHTWANVPEGEIQVSVNAEGFRPRRETVSVIRDMEPVEIVLSQRNFEVERLLVKLLTECWEGSPQAKMNAERTYVELKQLTSDDLIIDYARALVLLSAGLEERALRTLDDSVAKQSHLLGEPLNALVMNRSLELRLWLQLKTGQRQSPAQLIRKLATSTYAAGPETSGATATIAMMGRASGFLQGPGNSPRLTEGLDQDVVNTLFTEYVLIYQEGSDEVRRDCTERQVAIDNAIALGKSKVQQKKEQEIPKITKQLEIIDNRMAELQKEDQANLQKANARLDEIKQELDGLQLQAVRLRTDVINLDARIINLKAQLKGLQNPRVPAGFGRGGGAFLQPQETETHDKTAFADMLPISTQTVAFVQNPQDVDEPGLVQRIVIAERDKKTAEKEYAGILSKMQDLTNEDAKIREEFGRLRAELNVPYKKYEVEKAQLEQEIGRLRRADPQDTEQVNEFKRNQKSVDSYVQYDAVLRRDELVNAIQSGR